MILPLINPTDYIVVLSDLHLADGTQHDVKDLSSGEMFFYDDVFEHFLDYLRKQSIKYQRPCTLLILGDLVDFLHVRDEHTNHYRVDSSRKIIQNKLERIFESHSVFFSALAKFATDGFQIHIVPGNHDIELLFNQVQSMFKEQITSCGLLPEHLPQIRFFPWIYYKPGLLYAEHGHQYHDINSFNSMLKLIVDKNLTDIQHPPGAYIDEYIFNKHDFDKNNKVFLLRLHLRLVYKLLSTIFIRVFERQNYRTTRNAYVAHSIADELNFEILHSIDKSSLNNIINTIIRVLKKYSRRSYASVTEYIYQRARLIHNILIQYEKDVAFYVFGHTHIAKKIPLFANSKEPYYLNTGSWVCNNKTENNVFTFVEILSQANGDKKQANLMYWDNAKNKAVRYEAG